MAKIGNFDPQTAKLPIDFSFVFEYNSAWEDRLVVKTLKKSSAAFIRATGSIVDGYLFGIERRRFDSYSSHLAGSLWAGYHC